jgi:prophage tail gpP-like protein
MTGNVEAVNMPTYGQTQLEIKGRDNMAPLMKASILDEVTLQSQSYAELVKDVLSKVGLGDKTLSFSNEANRQLVTRTKFRKRRAKQDVNKNQLVATIDTGIQAPGGGKVQLQHLLAKVGETWYQWLEKELMLAGLILWCSGDGNFVLGSPTLDQEALYRVMHQKDQTRDEVNIVDCHLNNDFTNQHTTVTAYGRYGATAGGRTRAQGTCINVDAYAHTGGQGIFPLVIEDDNVKNDQQAFYRANRAMSEECRAGFSLQYTFSGHRMPCAARGHEEEMVIWAPDTITNVEDDWLGFRELMYNESVTFRCNEKTETVVDMVRPRYLAYYGTTPPPA